jgi:hypothetical protein
MSVLKAFGLLILATAACSDPDTTYGAGHPGQALAEGGEIRHENVRILGMTQTWIMVYQYTGPAKEMNAPFAAPEMGGKGQFGMCVDERASATWPVHPITGATFLDLPKVELTGPGITGTLSIPKSNPPNTIGNSTFRTYGFTYGGGGLDAMAKVTGFNATLTPGEAVPGGTYTLDIGKKGGPGTDGGTKMTYYMPDAYTTPLGIGGAAPVMIKAHQDLEFTWTPPVQKTGDGGTHIRETHFNFTFFADPASPTNPPQFICFPDKDGHTLIPTAVIDALPAGGLIVNADLGHYMDSREANPGEFRRFDLVSIYCNISAYMKQ